MLRTYHECQVGKIFLSERNINTLRKYVQAFNYRNEKG